MTTSYRKTYNENAMPDEPQSNPQTSASTMSSVVSTPLIGITCRWNAERNSYDLPAEYAEAVTAAGGVPALIPLIPAAAAALAGRLHGIVLSGSPSDVDPTRYGTERHPTVTNVVDALDATCIAFIAWVIKTLCRWHGRK